MKFRVITNGDMFRAQVRTFLFWIDIDHNGWRSWEPYRVSHEFIARNYIKKFKERRAEEQSDRGPWTSLRGQP